MEKRYVADMPGYAANNKRQAAAIVISRQLAVRIHWAFIS
jgi:hypothetical protein